MRIVSREQHSARQLCRGALVRHLHNSGKSISSSVVVSAINRAWRAASSAKPGARVSGTQICNERIPCDLNLSRRRWTRRAFDDEVWAMSAPHDGGALHAMVPPSYGKIARLAPTPVCQPSLFCCHQCWHLNIACGQIDIGITARGRLQATGRVEAEPCRDVDHVACGVVYMASCRSTPTSRFMTVMRPRCLYRPRLRRARREGHFFPHDCRLAGDRRLSRRSAPPIAWCELRQDFRNFRADRSGVPRSALPGAAERPQSEMAAHLGAAMQRAGRCEPATARVRSPERLSWCGAKAIR
jgi:hypothetical protein